MDLYTVRPAGDGDLLGLVRLHDRQESPAGTLPPDGPSEVQRRTWAQMMASSNLWAYLAERGGEVVGTTGMTIVANLINDCRPTAFVEPMLVAASHRRCGVGRLLVEQLLADARTEGVYKVQLLSHKRHASDGAHDFYRGFGFEPEAEGFRLYLHD